MSQRQSEYLTTRELAELLRLKERKIYELAASGTVPCTRTTGRLLFPRRAVEAWIARNSSGVGPETLRSEVFLGSHDPLLEWALRESRCGCATFFDGSLDGLKRFSRREGIATALHVFAPEREEWNRPEVEARFASEPVVLVELGWRERGLIVTAGNPRGISGLDVLAGARVVSRQATAGTQALFEHLVQKAGLLSGDLHYCVQARTETDAAIAVLDGNADAAFGLLGMAKQFRLDFVPVLRERFDLLLDRRAWFEPPLQTFLRFCATGAFTAKARALGGYDVSGFGRVHFNGAG